MPQIIAIVGKSGSGKTTYIEKLLPALKRKGLKIGTIKHAFHGFNFDTEGKDSWRHREAGADTVLVASDDKIAIMKNEKWKNIHALSKHFEDMDIVIAEGYSSESCPKIEIYREEVHEKPLCREDKNLVAIITDADINMPVPTFKLDEIEETADLIEKKYVNLKCV